MSNKNYNKSNSVLAITFTLLGAVLAALLLALFIFVPTAPTETIEQIKFRTECAGRINELVLHFNTPLIRVEDDMPDDIYRYTLFSKEVELHKRLGVEPNVPELLRTICVDKDPRTL